MDNEACANERTNGSPPSPTRQMSDVGCQTDGDNSSKLLFSQTIKDWLDTAPTDVVGSSVSPSASSSTVQNQTNPTSTVNGSNQPVDLSKKTTKPTSSATQAGVKPNSVAEYFADKQNAAPGSNTVTSTTANKVRTSSTTGVIGEGKKCVRSSTAMQQQSGSTSSGSSSKSNDGPSWSDENSKLRLTINSFSHLDETMCSEAKMIEGVSWKIMVMPKQHMVQKRQQKCMGFFLQCSPEKAYSDQWSVHAIADMRMLSYKQNVPHFARRTTHTYTSKENDWGYSCFMTWADILDESQGYIRNDCVILEIAVKSDPPKNMMNHAEFLDKVQKWIVLADMQMKKGNVDLALEANESAIKFCKGKDEKCLLQLDEQRKVFVNAKLVDSIQRIEKGKVPVACTEPTHGKPTSLRQALSGAQKSLNGKITAKGGKKTRAVVTVQHMKNKKKPNNSANQHRVSSGNATVKDLVEIRKNNKADDKGKDKENEHQKQPQCVVSNQPESHLKEEMDLCSSENSTESRDSDDDFEYDDDDVAYTESPFPVPALEKAYIEHAEDGEEEDAVFREAGLPEHMHALNCQPFGETAREAMARAASLIGPERDENVWKKWNDNRGLSTAQNELVYQGENSKNVLICDRFTQTELPNDLGKENSNQHSDTMEAFNSDNDIDSIIPNDCPPFKRIREEVVATMREEDEDDDDDDEEEEEESSDGEDDVPTYIVDRGVTCYNFHCSSRPLDKIQFEDGNVGRDYSPSLEFHSKWMDTIKTDEPRVSCFTSPEAVLEFTNLVLGTDLRVSDEDCNGGTSSSQSNHHHHFIQTPMPVVQSPISVVQQSMSVASSDTLIKFDEKLLKEYFNIEGAILQNLKEDSVLGRMSKKDRKEVVDEISSKICPMIVSLDLDFRDGFCSAQLFLDDSKKLYTEANTLLNILEIIRNSLEEKIYPLIGEVNGIDKTSLHKFHKEKTVTTSAAATSGSKPKHRHTIVARRTKPVRKPAHHFDNNDNEAKEPEDFELELTTANSLADIQLNLRTMTEWMNNFTERLQINSKKLRQTVSNVFGDEGAPKTLRVLHDSRNNQMDQLNDEITNLKIQVDELKRESDNYQMRASVLGGELLVEKDKHKNCAKEIKDLRNAVKKAETRGTKEENRANSNQVQLNEMDDKMKALRKELDSIKKKTVEERTKTKKEKERDTQTIRAQTNELNSREKERDRALNDLEDSKKAKDRADKENKQLSSQLSTVIERARSAEAALLESKMSVAMDILNKRKAELLLGFNETQKNLNIVRQASDRDLLRKSLAEWKTALDKCEGHMKSITNEFECSIRNVRAGSSTLAQVGEIKVPIAEPLPKLVKPPPVQVVAPSTAPAPPPVLSTPAAGVIGQQRSTPVVSRNTTCTESPNVSACSTPSRSRVSRLPSPVGTPNKSTDSNNFWSWNTIGNIGEWGKNESSFNNSIDQFQRDIWAVNGNSAASIGGTDFLRSSSLNSSSSQQPSSSTGPSTSQQPAHQSSIPTQSQQQNSQSIPALSQLIRQHQQQQQQQVHSQVPSSQSMSSQHLNSVTSRNPTSFLPTMSYNTEIWNTRNTFQSQQQQQQQQQLEQAAAQLNSMRLSNIGQYHNGAGDQSNGSNAFANLSMLNPLANPWRPIQQHPNSSGGHLNSNTTTVSNTSSNGTQFPYFE